MPKWRIFFTAAIMVAFSFIGSFLDVLGASIKAKVAVMQIDDSAITYSLANAFQGRALSMAALATEVAVLALIWAPYINRRKAINKEEE